LTAVSRQLRRATTALPLAIGAGVALGIAAWWSDELGYPAGALVPANAVGAWGLVAFASGSGARTVPGSAFRGLFALVAAVAAYYLAYAVLGDGWRSLGAARAATIWGGMALVAGPVLGLAGGVWRYGRGPWRASAVGLPAGILVIEGLLAGLGRSDAVAVVLLVEVGVGILLPVALLRGSRARAVAWAATAVVALIGAFGLTVVIPALRAAADRF
jgi:hypothetical protein